MDGSRGQHRRRSTESCLRGGLILALCPRTEQAKDAKIPLHPPMTGEFSIATRSQAKPKSTRSSRRPRLQAQRSPTSHTTVRGASTQATSATSTATYGRSYGIRGLTARRRDLGNAAGRLPATIVRLEASVFRLTHFASERSISRPSQPPCAQSQTACIGNGRQSQLICVGIYP